MNIYNFVGGEKKFKPKTEKQKVTIKTNLSKDCNDKKRKKDLNLDLYCTIIKEKKSDLNIDPYIKKNKKKFDSNYEYKDYYNLLMQAVNRNFVKVIESLLKNGADANILDSVNGMRPLTTILNTIVFIYNSATNKKPKKEEKKLLDTKKKIFDLLIKYGADPRLRDSKNDYNAFLYAKTLKKYYNDDYYFNKLKKLKLKLT